ncbi:S-layer homology domain-containing protein [Fenollaria sporofastidiosus]|uniref:S-layer homology domain-containing protein n=1 Tax=Fenollaria sporofastidiosus TaxID=2811778 RepID=UPI001BFFF85B|nr:S-layer homology domain-containing protein [Fenollaria sporofastidiosus]
MKKKVLGLLLALMMLVTMSADAAYALSFSEVKLSDAKGIYFEDANLNPDELDPNLKLDEDIEPVKVVEPEAKVLEEENNLDNAGDTLELGEEREPEAVATPAGFSLDSINTIAKDQDGNCYGVKTYGGDRDNVLTKYFYKIDEADYNTLSQDFLMTFKRKDGQPFKVYDSKISNGDISEATPSYSDINAVFTELQFKHQSAYDVVVSGNYSPVDRIPEQGNLTWIIELNKDWDIKATPGFTDRSNTRSIYMNYDVELDGKNHKIHNTDNKSEIILQLGSGHSGASAIVRTATLKNLTIDGKGFDENVLNRCIKVYDKGVLNLENVQIINGNTDQVNDGAGITLGSEGKLNMDAKSSIKDCLAIRGAAINADDNTILNINGSKFINNLADLGGAICSLNKKSTINIKDATFVNNQAILLSFDGYANGGAIYTQSNTSIENSTFVNNYAQKSGGAIYHISAPKFDIKGSTFKNNGILRIPQGTYFTNKGGAIYANEVNISDNCTFEGNIADYGGALINNEKAEISDSIFKGNQSSSGGSIYSFKNLIIHDKCTFENNEAYHGGAIYANNLTINKTEFNNNKAYKMGGAIYAKDTVKIIGSNFKENTAAQQGGAIYLLKGGSEIKDSIFYNNGSNLGGGAVLIAKDSNGITSIQKTSFIHNFSNELGGGVLLSANGKLEINESKFIDNDASYGAGISSSANGNVDKNLNNIKVTNSIFDDNTSYMGAGIFTAFPTEINSYTFTKNKAALKTGDDEKNPHVSGVGGAVEVINNTTIIKNTTFEGNYAYGSGGALGINGVERHDNENKDISSIKNNIKVEISEGTKFIGNTCGVGQGGAIYTIPFLYDLEGYGTSVNENTLKQEGYKNLKISHDTLFKDNLAFSGFADPPDNYQNYVFLDFSKNTFSERINDQITAKSLLNNYDVNYKNEKISAYFDPNGGEFTNEANPKAIRVVKEDKVKISDEDKGAEFIILQAPKRDGYKFLGWKGTRYVPGANMEERLKLAIEKAKAEIHSFERIYNPGEKVTLKSNFIFTAQWEKASAPSTLILTLDENYPHGKITDYDVMQGEFIDPYLYTPRRRGYVFEGWSYSRDRMREVRKGDQVYTNTVLYAMWTKRKAKAEEAPEPEEIKGQEHKAYIFGYPDGTVRPNGKITRAEAAAMLARLLDIEAYGSADAPMFPDTPSSWYNKAINAVVTRGIMQGYPDGNFRPNSPITRAEFTKMIAVIDNKPYGTAPFADVIGHWAERPIGAEYQAKRILGYPDGTFRPDAHITRCEAAVILNKIFERNFDAMSLIKCKNPQMIKYFTDLDISFWGYNDMVEATNTHEYIRRTKNRVEEDWLLIK